VDVALELATAGYVVVPQFEVAGKRIDLVVEGGVTRVAVECDGDEFHGPERYEEDMQRQRMLERCGWTFCRIRGSAFYSNKSRALEDLRRKLDAMEIRPRITPPAPVAPPPRAAPADVVAVGDSVVYAIEETGEERQIQIARGPSNIGLGAANVNTPLAQALLGAKVGQVVQAHLPIGREDLRILRILRADRSPDAATE
jgi:transcription elongation GreA/GreB family factor